jgi:hypothetical protein
MTGRRRSLVRSWRRAPGAQGARSRSSSTRTRATFDAAHLRRRVFVAVARGGKGATVEYNPRAHEDAEKQVKQFLQLQLKP